MIDVEVNFRIWYDLILLCLFCFLELVGRFFGAYLLLLSSESGSTPVILVSTKVQRLWSAKIKLFGSFLDSSLTRDVIMSGIGIVSQLLL